MADDPNANAGGNYFYDPSIAAAVVAAVLYGLLFIFSTWQMFRYKTWYMIVLFIGGFMEVIGYITRIISAKSPYPLWAAIVSQTGLIVAPAFFAAQAYMIVGRMIAHIGNEHSYIGHSKITKIFVGSDIFSIITQAGGGAMLAGADGDLDKMKTAKNILLTGLALQVVTFGIFLFVAVAFHLKSNKALELKPHGYAMGRMRSLWIAFYVSGVLITGRSIYRTAEFGEIKFNAGEDDPVGYALTHEWPMYAFDSIPILIAMLCFSVWHPGRYLPSRKGLRIDGTYEEPSKGFLCFGRRPKSSRSPSAMEDGGVGSGNEAMTLRPVS